MQKFRMQELLIRCFRIDCTAMIIENEKQNNPLKRIKPIATIITVSPYFSLSLMQNIKKTKNPIQRARTIRGTIKEHMIYFTKSQVN